MSAHPPLCPLCGAASTEVVFDLSEPRSAEEIPGLVRRCRACPMWFKELTGPEPLPKAYPGEYGHDHVAETYLAGGAARAFFRTVLAGLEPHRGSGRPRLLDIGAGPGALLREAAQLGYDAEGIDHCRENVEEARAAGLEVREAAAEDLDVRETYDVVALLDILEHLPDPMRVLRAAQRALRPGGQVVIYTPNHRAAVVLLARALERLGVRGPAREIFGRNHVVFFDDRSLPLALEKAGFALRGVRRFRYDWSRPGQHVPLPGLAAVALAEALGTPFGRVFRLLAYARKA